LPKIASGTVPVAGVVAGTGVTAMTAQVTDRAGHAFSRTVKAGGTWKSAYDPVADAHDWYDLTITLDGYPGFSR
jgi:hypothetical protein